VKLHSSIESVLMSIILRFCIFSYPVLGRPQAGDAHYYSIFFPISVRLTHVVA